MPEWQDLTLQPAPPSLGLIRGLDRVLLVIDEMQRFPVTRVTPGPGRWLLSVDWRDYSGFTPAVDYAAHLSLRLGIEIEAETDYVLSIPVTRES